MAEMRYTYTVLIVRSERNRLIRRYRHGCKNVSSVNIVWIQLAQDRIQWYGLYLPSDKLSASQEAPPLYGV
jgi:hypothetical protein